MPTAPPVPFNLATGSATRCERSATAAPVAAGSSTWSTTWIRTPNPTHQRHLSKATPEGLEALRVADARQGLPECYARWEEAVLSATGDSVYRSNEFEL